MARGVLKSHLAAREHRFKTCRMPDRETMPVQIVSQVDGKADVFALHLSGILEWRNLLNS